MYCIYKYNVKIDPKHYIFFLQKRSHLPHGDLFYYLRALNQKIEPSMSVEAQK